MGRKAGTLPSSWGAKARAAATALKNQTPTHLSPAQFGGGRHASANESKMYGGSSHMPRHAAGGGTGRHQGSYSAVDDASGVAKSGGSAQGRHARSSWFSK